MVVDFDRILLRLPGMLSQQETEALFRRLQVNRRRVVQHLTLHPQQLAAFDAVFAGYNTTSLLRKHLGISTQHASLILSRLHKRGYLSRERVPDPTGGYMFEYHSCV